MVIRANGAVCGVAAIEVYVVIVVVDSVASAVSFDTFSNDFKLQTMRVPYCLDYLDACCHICAQ